MGSLEGTDDRCWVGSPVGSGEGLGVGSIEGGSKEGFWVGCLDDGGKDGISVGAAESFLEGTKDSSAEGSSERFAITGYQVWFPTGIQKDSLLLGMSPSGIITDASARPHATTARRRVVDDER